MKHLSSANGRILPIGQHLRGEGFDPLRIGAMTATGAALTRPTGLTRANEEGISSAAGRPLVSRPGFPGKAAPEAAADEAAVTPSPNVTVARDVAKTPEPPGQEPVGDPWNKAAIGETGGAREAGGEDLIKVDYAKSRAASAPGERVQGFNAADPALEAAARNALGIEGAPAAAPGRAPAPAAALVPPGRQDLAARLRAIRDREAAAAAPAPAEPGQQRPRPRTLAQGGAIPPRPRLGPDDGRSLRPPIPARGR